ncbi:MAG: hypothetical protein KY468_10015 [Armatimonadetes bacterium]|nr:hypothetical protein [Armatimonadota bacterium]
MPAVDIERKESTGVPGWVWIIVGLLVLGLLAWLLTAQPWRAGDANVPAVGQVIPGVDNTEGTTATTAGTAGAGEGAWFPVAAIRANPDAHFGQTITGVVTVSEVAAPGGFWSDINGEKMFFVAEGAAPNLTAGQRVSVTGTVRDPQQMEQVPSVMQMPEETRRYIQNEKAFVQASKIDVLES